ncbi:amino acid adenylation domain-containing protein [Micromonospora sp. NPDC048871]|uniref:amino acid adenylation domain-containing protein n=1 Tax=unclassified Micromonospora TaxID=2617518 RepID=UPI002E12F99D|nr:amino acid adenylation domain-containing protein [Micromonospora sp. NBC_01739]
MSTIPTLYDWFAESARRHPDRLALRAGGLDFSYRQLTAAAAQLAEDIVARQGRRPARVGVFVSRTAGTYVAYLAALRLGVTVVPLNTDFPPARHARIARTAGLDLLLHTAVDADLAEAVGTQTGTARMAAPDEHRGPTAPAGPPEEYRPDPDELAYIVFTSGSTGTPKGVPIRHRNVAHWLPYVLDYFEAGPDIRVSQTSDLAWDLSVWNVFLPWATGGALVVPERTELLAPSRHINDDGITHWFSTPSSIVTARMLDDLTPDTMPGLRWSCFGGEPLTLDKARAWRDAAPNSVIANVYGPTETTVTCLTYRAPADPLRWPRAALGALPLGPAYPTVECDLMDEEGRPADEGELLIRGPQRFDGYLDPADNVGRFTRWQGDRWRMEEGEPLTEEHWFRTGDRVRRTDNGYVFLGRMDNQVKVNGYRIETGEIEAVLRQHDAVDEAAVVPWQAEDGTVELAAFYVGDQAGQEDLEGFLAEQLPTYMIPPRLGWIERFPLNVNGKIDRHRLVEMALTMADV